MHLPGLKNIKRCSTVLSCILLFALVLLPSHDHAAEPATQCQGWQESTVQLLHSKRSADLCTLMQGKPVLVVNTASHCGFTRQFAGLEALYQRYKDKGLVVLGFPSNDFNQEANDSSEIADVCYKNYGVSFVMTEPVILKGPEALPLFRHLSEQTSAPQWNFNKYLINAEGQVVGYFPSTTEPDSSRLINAIQEIL